MKRSGLRSSNKCLFCSISLQFVHDDRNLSMVAEEVDDVLLTLLVDEIVKVENDNF